MANFPLDHLCICCIVSLNRNGLYHKFTYTDLYINTYIYVYQVHMYLPSSTCMAVFSVPNPMILSALHLKTSPLLASVIVIVETFPLVGSGDPLRNH